MLFWQPEDEFKNVEISDKIKTRLRVLHLTNRSEGTSIRINGHGASLSSSESIKHVS